MSFGANLTRFLKTQPLLVAGGLLSFGLLLPLTAQAQTDTAAMIGYHCGVWKVPAMLQRGALSS